MGSSSKSKYKEKDQSRSSKRRHESPNGEDYDNYREKRHKHKHRHHKERRREKSIKIDYESDGRILLNVYCLKFIHVVLLGSDVVEVVPIENNKNEVGESSGQGAESLSVEETNKLRAKLGLKPLEINSSDVGKKNDGKKKDDLGEFYHKPAENLSEKAEREKFRAKLSEHKEKRQLQNKLNKVRALGEGSDSDDDVSNWVNKSRKLATAKKEAEKRVC